MEDWTNKRVSIETKLHLSNPKLSHHTSLHYNTSFFSKNPIFKRNKSTEVVLIENIKKEEIFELVFGFTGKLISNKNYLEKVIKDMKYETEDKQMSVSKIHSNEEISCNSINSINSEDGIQEEDKENQKSNKNNNSELNLPLPEIPFKKLNKEQKTSIMLSSSSSLNSGSKISCSSQFSISSINFPPHVLSLELVRQIFEEPEPFLINLAMCLMTKFLFYSKMEVTNANACWIMSIGTIIAYKIYFDEPVGGLVESFADILEISRSNIMDLERYFLSEIDFQAAITNEQYHIMLSKIIKG